MTSKKDLRSSTKIQEDENTDSGFLSGPISEQLYSGDCDLAEESESRVDIKVSDDVQIDSGLDLSLSDYLSKVQLDDSSVQSPIDQEAPLVTVLNEPTRNKSPLERIFEQDDDGDTQLHIAAVRGCEASVGILVRVCPDKAWFDVPNDDGQTALHLAAKSGQAIITRMLVRAGAALAVRDFNGETPLHCAVAAGSTECIQALLAPVPEHPPRKLSVVLNQKNYNGQTCVHLAATAGNKEALQTLVFYGADINAREGLAGWTPLHIAAARGDVSTAQYLLEKCPGVFRNIRDYGGRTARRLANRTEANKAFRQYDSSDSESDSDELYDSEQSLFDKLLDSMPTINVA